jgi:hypothetical protein
VAASTSSRASSSSASARPAASPAREVRAGDVGTSLLEAQPRQLRLETGHGIRRRDAQGQGQGVGGLLQTPRGVQDPRAQRLHRLLPTGIGHAGQFGQRRVRLAPRQVSAGTIDYRCQRRAVHRAG